MFNLKRGINKIKGTNNSIRCRKLLIHRHYQVFLSKICILQQGNKLHYGKKFKPQ